MKNRFSQVVEKPDFAKEEERILEYWTKIGAFELQLEKTKNLKPYTFYDGPPFATGLPHYGHIAAGTIKDVITRYAAQTGHYVERRFGWDCHGLPIEFEIDKMLKINTKKEVLQMGIAEYNKQCKSIVMRYSKEWRTIVTRLGRWIDFDNDYKTMDVKFMESVWWVFKKMWERGLIYRAAKVVPYSNGCNTVLSNFEAGSNFQDTDDPSVFLTFPLVKDPNVKLVAWTTTPWTLPSNLALAVNPKFTYVKIHDTKLDQIFIISEGRLPSLYGKDPDAYKILEKLKGTDLENLEYVPLYDCFHERRKDGCFRILCAEFVQEDTGTGVVHIAPAFGEDDFKLAINKKIITSQNLVCPIDENGFFTQEVGPNLRGQYIKSADPLIVADLKSKGRIIRNSTIKHSYPFCWRSNTPLIYKAVKSWFIKVTDIKADMMKNNFKSRWVPQNIQEKRFNNWLSEAQDWCFSRSRFWGNPIPIWASDDYEEQVCVGSLEELQKLTGATVTDLHREHLDNLTIPSKQGKGVLRRIDEVFDCWFESGAMPFAQVNYPFSVSEEKFSQQFPADFIGEGVDQTRGWFYTLNVIATAIRNDTPYKNLIVNGIVLAEDGKKMSKSLRNYPDPMAVVNRFGADAIRLYLVTSPLVKADSLNFKEKGVEETVRQVFLPWYNSYRFLLQNITRWEEANKKSFIFNQDLLHNQGISIMDRWIIAANQNLIKSVRNEMENYRLYTVVPKLLGYLENLTNWYVRLNRPRLKGEVSDNDWTLSLNTLYSVLLNLTILMSPFVPFISEMIYENLKLLLPQNSPQFDQSIHFIQMPTFDPKLIDEHIEFVVSEMQGYIDLARILREKRKVNLKQPIMELKILTDDQKLVEGLKPLMKYIEDELNVATVTIEKDTKGNVKVVTQPNHKVLGERLKAQGKKYTKELQTRLANLTMDELAQLSKKSLLLEGVEVNESDIIIKRITNSDGLSDLQEIGTDSSGRVVLLDVRQTEELKQMGLAREVQARIQQLRKKAGLSPENDIIVFYEVHPNSKILTEALKSHGENIQKNVKKAFCHVNLFKSQPIIYSETIEFEVGRVTITLRENVIPN